MEQVMKDIAKMWEERIGNPIANDAYNAIEVILEQVSEFQNYLSDKNPSYEKNIEEFIRQMYYTYRSGVTRSLSLSEWSICDRCSEYIVRNQEELFGVKDSVPQPHLYTAIIVLTISLSGRNEITERITEHIDTMHQYCKHVLHLYDDFITRALSNMNHRLGTIEN